MNDKKSCESCVKVEQCTICTAAKVLGEKCAAYQRNPDKWLSVLPQEKDLRPREVATPFFWRASAESKSWTILLLSAFSGTVITQFGCTSVAELGGEWQGPIVPKEDK